MTDDEVQSIELLPIVSRESARAALYADPDLALKYAGLIRVLDLEPTPWRGKISDRLNATLRIASLEDVRFNALSYVWGPPSKAVEDCIVVNGHCIQLTKNCREALQQVRAQFGGVTIWVDSICINQNSTMEKNHQIPLMGSIYTNADFVYIWLGQGDPIAERALRFARNYSYRGELLCPLLVDRAHMPALLLFGGIGLTMLEGLYIAWMVWIFSLYLIMSFLTFCNCGRGISYRRPNPRFVDDMIMLLQAEWITRVWTFQELLLASRPILLYGSECVSWNNFFEILNVTSRDRERHLHTTQRWLMSNNLWAQLPRPAPRKLPLIHRKHRKFIPDAVRNVVRQLASIPLIRLTAPKYHRLHENSLDIDYRRQDLTRRRRFGRSRLFGILIAPLPMVVGDLIAVPYLQGNQIFWFAVVVLFEVMFFTLALCSVTLLTDLADSQPQKMETTTPEPASPIQSPNVSADDDHGVHSKDKLRSLVLTQKVARENNCGNPLDRVFALREIFKRFGIRDGEGLPDYEQPLHEVYGTWFIALAETQASLNYLIDAGAPKTEPDSPSWVPNWNAAQEKPWLLTQLIYDPQKYPLCQRSPNFEVDKACMKMTVEAVVSTDLLVCAGPFYRIGDTLDAAQTSKLECHNTLQLLRWMFAVRFESRTTDIDWTLSWSALQALTTGRASAHECETRLGNWYRAVISFLDQSDRTSAAHIGQEQVEAVLNILRANIELDSVHSWICQQLAEESRAMIMTTQGFLGSTRLEAQAGDYVVLIPTVSMPMIMRSRAGGEYEIIGPAFIRDLLGKELQVEAMERIIIV